MSPQAKSVIRTGVVTALIGSSLLWLSTIAWAQKVDRPEFEAFVHEVKRSAIRDSAWMAEQRLLTLDIYCNLSPTSQRCK